MRRHYCLLSFALASFLGCAGPQSVPKDIALKNCSKTVTVFMDEEAEKIFQELKIEMRYVLELINLNFASQGVDSRYDIQSIEIKRWNYKFEDLPYRKNSEQVKISLTSLRDRHKSEKIDSDVHIFLTGRVSLGEGSVKNIGWKFWIFGNRGRGSMLVGADDYFSRIIHLSFDRATYMTTLAQVIAHEQGHLYGLHHVAERNSLMYSVSEFGKARLLDAYSKKKLQKILRSEKKCSAR